MKSSYLLQIKWETLLVGSDGYSFLLETLFRSLVMFLVILLTLRMLGKRGVKQLSVFELGVIIGLGSAAGDPMFYKDVGILTGMVVFLVVIALYKLVTFLINRFEGFEQFVEGSPTYVIREGKLLTKNFKNEPIARDELYMQMRLNNVSHLGQVELAILENNGEVSLYYYPDEDVRSGLPILPHCFDNKLVAISKEGVYACTNCGLTLDLQPAAETHCPECRKKHWLPARKERRLH